MMPKLSVSVCQHLIWTSLGTLRIPKIPFWHNSIKANSCIPVANSVQNSAGIVLSIWQVLGPKWISPEFQELPGLWQESVGDSKDLDIGATVAQVAPLFVWLGSARSQVRSPACGKQF
jgi:hypothetical protein